MTGVLAAPGFPGNLELPLHEFLRALPLDGRAPGRRCDWPTARQSLARGCSSVFWPGWASRTSTPPSSSSSRCLPACSSARSAASSGPKRAPPASRSSFSSPCPTSCGSGPITSPLISSSAPSLTPTKTFRIRPWSSSANRSRCCLCSTAPLWIGGLVWLGRIRESSRLALRGSHLPVLPSHDDGDARQVLLHRAHLPGSLRRRRRRLRPDHSPHMAGQRIRGYPRRDPRLRHRPVSSSPSCLLPNTTPIRRSRLPTR